MRVADADFFNVGATDMRRTSCPVRRRTSHVDDATPDIPSDRPAIAHHPPDPVT